MAERRVSTVRRLLSEESVVKNLSTVPCRIVARCVVAALFANVAVAGAPPGEKPYPLGRAFPLGLYSIARPADMQAARRSGWNIAQSYGFKPEFLQKCADGGMLAIANIGSDKGKGDNRQGWPEAKVRDAIAAMADSDRVFFWSIPEELRYWRKPEMAILRDYPAWVRKYDPARRPTYMYLPNHYGAEAIAKYVPHLDIICAGTYTTNGGHPHAWVRWRMEAILNAITQAGCQVGGDYPKGEKIPMAVLELYRPAGKAKADVVQRETWPERTRVMTPEGAYHDFWQSIACGARGILIYSYWHIRDHADLPACWEMYCKAAAELTGPGNLDQLALYGKSIPGIKAEVVGGVVRTVEFVVGKDKPPVRYSAVNLRGMELDGRRVLIVVNSAESLVQCKITGLPEGTARARRLFAEGAYPVAEGALSLDLGPLGVCILELEDE